MIYIFLDDERSMREPMNPDYEYITIRDPHVAKAFLHIHRGEDIIIDLDHDLGTNETGYDVCKYIIANGIPLVGFKIHSMNPVGAFNMRQLLTHYGYQEV